MRKYIIVLVSSTLFISCKSEHSSSSYPSGGESIDGSTLEITESLEDLPEINEGQKLDMPVQVCDSLLAEYSRYSRLLFVEKKEALGEKIEAMKNSSKFYYCKEKAKFSKSIDSIDNHYLESEIDLDNVF